VVYALGVSKKVANDKGGWPKANDPAPEHLLLDPPTLGESMASDWQTVQGKDPLPGRRHDIPLMTEDGLKDFVLGCCNGHIFTSNQVPDEEAQHLLGSIFMPLVFGALKNYDQESIENIGVLWEHMSEAAPRGINGYPMFFSCRIMHKDDWTRARAAIKKELHRREAIEL